MITITIKTDNAAFQEDRTTEVARILGRLASKLVHGCMPASVYDSNGNKVGTITLTGKDRRL